LGLIDTQYLVRVLEALVARDRQTLLSALSLLKSHGLDYYRFLEDLIDAFHLLTMVQLSKEMGEHENAELVALAEAFTAEDLQLYYQIALNGRKSDRKSTRLNSSHVSISYAVFCLKKKN